MPELTISEVAHKSDSKHRLFGTTRELDYFPGPRERADRDDTTLQRFTGWQSFNVRVNSVLH
jgi:hypothetical protein